MKLILLIYFISLAVDEISADHFTFPPKFHPPNSGLMMSSDSSVYLPPEAHTAIPYYPMKNVNNLPYPYLPHTGTKAPVILPTPYPIMLSSTLLPLDHNDDDDEDEEQLSSSQRNNRTERSNPYNIERRDMRGKFINYQPIDRIDMKVPIGFSNNNGQKPQNAPIQKATSRSMILSMDHQKGDVMEQLRGAAAFQGPQYLPAPNIPGVYLSSTTETAVPILRLSSEMDLDGSFSYEALGADQTHYVQHSRMENSGTDKEEQVVEGSYSYVGDNGQTYTVHYVADSNGFRASGDHLPVAPAIPEIIQRAVQFNLAEEAKKPPNLKSWNEENESKESERYSRYAILPPPRPLFTGKTPESFSFGFSQGAHNTPNNLMPPVSTQNPIRMENDFTQEQIKKNNANIVNNGGTISPQITFLASQGAHVPSANTQQQQQQQQSTSRLFTTDRPTLPQLMNFEQAVKESDQSENNKGLWRWQYGWNANQNQSPEKNMISRSSGSGDDVIINFNDMTSDQYTKMIKSQLEPNIESVNDDSIAQPSNAMYKEPNDNSKFYHDTIPDSKQPIESTEGHVISTTLPDFENWSKNDNYKSIQNNYSYQPYENSGTRQNLENISDTRAKLITTDNFVPQSQMITQSYDYESNSYEPRKLSKTSSTIVPITLPNLHFDDYNIYNTGTQNILWQSSDQIENAQKVSTTEAPSSTSATYDKEFSDYIASKNKNDFKPMRPSQPDIKQDELAASTETTVENIFENNIFLKNLFNSKKNDQHEGNNIKDTKNNYQHKPLSYHQSKLQAERKPDKTPKLIQMQANSHNEMKESLTKPLDISDIMKYISAKNHFESIKIKPKSKYRSNNYNRNNEIRFIPVQREPEDIDDNDDEEESLEYNRSNHRTNHYHPEELRGIIKNYKVLQRNNSAFNSGQDVEPLKRDLSPPPAKKLQSNLPPLGRAGPSVKSYLPPIYI